MFTEEECQQEGGPRVKRDAKNSAEAGVACESIARATTGWVEAEPIRGWGCAQWEVVTAREQSPRQQPVLRMTVSSDVVESWQ